MRFNSWRLSISNLTACYTEQSVAVIEIFQKTNNDSTCKQIEIHLNYNKLIRKIINKKIKYLHCYLPHKV